MALDDFTPPDDRDGAPWPAESRAEAERRFVRADGTIGWGLWQHSLVHDAGGAPVYWVSHVLDISRRKGVERQLEERQAGVYGIYIGNDDTGKIDIYIIIDIYI